MRIRRLKLSGFKSFVEPAELRIEPGLTGIVGPNGCGKSNLLEAIRWAMGEASPKSLRGGGMEDVIFAGTTSRPPRDFAEVSILLEQQRAGEDGATRWSESEITRRIERGAGSAYRIDGRDVRAKDVALLFADAATGAHSPALVSQGRIGAVIAAKPTERRQLLEEAAGIAGLHARRKDAEGRLRATEANLQRLDELLGDQEARVAALRRQARAAERYRQLTDRIRLAEAKLLFARWREADEAARAASEQARGAESDVARLQTAMARAQEAQAQAARLVAERRDAELAARSAGQEAMHRLATARARREAVVRRLDELDRLYAALAAEIAREEALRDDAAQAVESLGKECEALARRIADGEGEASGLAARLGEAEAAAREVDAALAGLVARQAAMKAERRVAEAAVEAARAQAQRTAAERQRLEQQLAALGDGDEHRRAMAEAATDLAAAEQAQRTAEARLAEAEEARAAAAGARDQAESALATARAALAASEAEQAALTRALDQGGGTALAGLAADPGFEQALAAALGDDLEATIGGDGPRRWTGAEPAADDPPLPLGGERLADRVRAPAELGRRLAQVLVVDRDEGIALAVGQRLVTRDGRLRRWDGFVAERGGAAAAERLVRVNRLGALDRLLPDQRQAVEAAEGQRAAAEQAIAANRAAADEARAALQSAERAAREAVRASDTAQAALDRIDAQRSALVERQADVATLADVAANAVNEAEEALRRLPDPAAIDRDVEQARESATAAGEEVAERRAQAATRARETAAARERLAAAERERGEWKARGQLAEARLVETAERAAAQSAERTDLKGQPAELAAAVRQIEIAQEQSEATVRAAAAASAEAQAALDSVAHALAQAGEAFAQAREVRATAAARTEAQEARRADLSRQCGEAFECPPPLLPGRLDFDPDRLSDADEEKQLLDRLVMERERIGPVNLVAETELAELEESRAQGAREREELGEAILRLRGSIGSLNREGRVRLLEAFDRVDAHFRSLFTTLFGGGEAHLELVESDDPLEAGLEILAQPPGKRLTQLTLLSGGEQALTAVALIFALFLTNPAPICVLDEVDAPLDDANVDRFCALLERMTGETDTRYLIVTHNAVTMARMHRLYGVTMIEQGVSRLVSVDLGGAEELLAAE